MKIVTILPVLVLASVVGCGSRNEAAAAPVDPAVNLPVDQKIQNIQNDSKIPDGLKKIQTDTLRRQPH